MTDEQEKRLYELESQSRQQQGEIELAIVKAIAGKNYAYVDLMCAFTKMASYYAGCHRHAILKDDVMKESDGS